MIVFLENNAISNLHETNSITNSNESKTSQLQLLAFDTDQPPITDLQNKYTTGVTSQAPSHSSTIIQHPTPFPSRDLLRSYPSTHHPPHPFPHHSIVSKSLLGDYSNVTANTTQTSIRKYSYRSNVRLNGFQPSADGDQGRQLVSG